MITINQTVINKKGQKGTITRIITKSTGYVEVSYENGTTKKEMAFNLTDENGNALKKAPKKAEPKPVSPLQAAIAQDEEQVRELASEAGIDLTGLTIDLERENVKDDLGRPQKACIIDALVH